MRLNVYSITVDNRDNCQDQDDQEFITFVYARDYSTGKFYLDQDQSFVQDIKASNIISEHVVSEIDLALGLSLDVVLDLFHLYEVEPFKSVYERVQQYGGAEEGGWYYHTLEYQGEHLDDEEEEDSGMNRYGEGLEVRLEIVQGMHENLARRYYS